MKTFYTIVTVVILFAVYVLIKVGIFGYNTYVLSEQHIYRCADFETRKEAQAKFDSDNNRFASMDADNDGIVCEAKKDKIKTNLKPIQVK